MTVTLKERSPANNWCGGGVVRDNRTSRSKTLRTIVWPRTFAAAVSVLLIVNGCSKSRRNVDVRTDCIADSIGALQLTPSLPSCATDTWVCRVKCISGSSASCLALGYEVQKNPGKEDEAVRLYRRACLLGAANGCTNYAASIWARPHTDSDLACARRTFEKACSAEEPFACGMVGRLRNLCTSRSNAVENVV
jgi:hypothetical protein